MFIPCDHRYIVIDGPGVRDEAGYPHCGNMNGYECEYLYYIILLSFSMF